MHKVIIDGVEYVPAVKYTGCTYMQKDNLPLYTGTVMLNEIPSEKTPITIIIPSEFCDYVRGTVDIGSFSNDLNRKLNVRDCIEIKYGKASKI